MLELLESRIAPASLVNPKTVEFTDVDGDVVHVLLSQPLFDKAMHGFTFEPSGEGERLVSLALPPSATGVSLSIFVIKQSAEGDGAVNVGVIINRVDRLSVGGGITGNENNRVGITAGFSSTGMRKGFGVIDVGGSVAFAEISAGFERVGTLLGSSVSNPDARIGSLSVGGNWFASSVSAGVAPGSDGYFGTSDDLFAPTTNKQTRVVSAIAQIVIGGQVRGTSMESDYFGFVAGQIGKMSVGGASIPLREGRIDVVPIATETDDVTVREIKQL